MGEIFDGWSFCEPQARRLIKSAHEHAEVVMDIEFFEFLSR
jgi:hypothetical protein